ncbi:neurogenic locus notch, putative, partial [Ixodes scapularis]
FTGFSGRNCSTFDPCALRPSACLHDGVCRSNASHTFTCLCVDGYYGKTCLHRDPCFSSPCLNQGRCFNQSDVEFSCRCEPGFTGGWCESDAGDLCEQNVDECLSSPCKNKGECQDGINSFTCLCPRGYKGPLCE